MTLKCEKRKVWGDGAMLESRKPLGRAIECVADAGRGIERHDLRNWSKNSIDSEDVSDMIVM